MDQTRNRPVRVADANEYDPSRSRVARSRAAVRYDYGEPAVQDRYDGYDDGCGDHGSYGYDSYDGGARRVRWERWLIPVAIVLLAVVLLLSAGVYYAMRVSSLDTIYPNVTINGVAVGGMTQAEAERALAAAGVTVEADAAVTVRFSNGESLTVTAGQLGLTQTNDAAGQALTAYAFGRTGSLINNLRTYIACRSRGVDIPWDGGETPQLDEQALQSLVAQAAQDIQSEPVEQNAEVTDTEIHMTKAAAAVTVDEAAVCDLIRQAFQAGRYGPVDYELPTDQVQEDQAVTDELFQQLYDQVHTEPADAYIDATGATIESVQGVSFDMDQAKLLWSQAKPGEQVTIPLILTDPAVRTEDLAVTYFQDLLAEKSTSLAGSTSARINNITLAAQAMNGTVINPGQEFNYNQCLGERTAAKGYQSAGAFSGGQHIMSIGGGICQGSSTLYYCALLANLKITTRWCHQFLVTYLPRGLDATVSWGWPDFNFVNSRDYPIKIESYVSGGYLTVKLWGTDVDGSYVVMTTSEWEDGSHYYAQSYRNVYDRNGNLISSTEEAYSSYDKEGGGAVVTVTPDPAPTPAPVVTPAPETPPETGGGDTPAPPPPADTGGGDAGGGTVETPPETGGDTGGDVPAPPPETGGDTGGGDAGGGAPAPAPDTGGGGETAPDVPAE